MSSFSLALQLYNEQRLRTSTEYLSCEIPQHKKNKTLFHLEYSNDIVCTFETLSDAQSLLDSFSCSVALYGLKFATISFNWTEPVSSTLMEGEELEHAERLTYLGSCISANRNSTNESTVRISKAQAAFYNFHNLWCSTDVSLSTTGKIHNPTVRPTLLYACETWQLHRED